MVVVDRKCRSGDRVEIRFPMNFTLTLHVDALTGERRFRLHQSRPPDLFTEIGERWRQYPTEGWPAYEVFFSSPWNYGLIVDTNHPENSVRVVKQDQKIAGQPFSRDTAPIELRLKARRIPSWKQEANGMVGRIPQSPAASHEPIEDVTLIPMGCARLRISVFPVAAR
ncbi:MAG: hypothetical protein ACRD9L_19515 [Bryobacteraceae bacterium]